MAPPGKNERQPGHTGTIPKTKARNNCNVPQEAVTPTRRDMATNLVTTLDWVPVSEYNQSRSNYNQSRKPNNSSDHELTDLDTSVTFESGFGRFVPVRPQPRALPLHMQNRENISSEHHDLGSSSSTSGHLLQPYPPQIQNGQHSNHAAAAVMIVNPTTPNALTGNMLQPFNAQIQNQNRNNLTRNLNTNRNNFDGHGPTSNAASAPVPNARAGAKAVNLINNMYDQGQALNNLENHAVNRSSARALGEAIAAACPDAASVERRLGQIREYIRVTSSLVDTMRNSEDEAFIAHTREEYDELVRMVAQLRDSERALTEAPPPEPAHLQKVSNQQSEQRNEGALQRSIASCAGKAALLGRLRAPPEAARPPSAQSERSASSESELWQNEVKDRMEVSQMRLLALKQQQRRLLKYQEEAKAQLAELHRQRQGETPPALDGFGDPQSQAGSGDRFAANQGGGAAAPTQPAGGDSQQLDSQSALSNDGSYVMLACNDVGGEKDEEHEDSSRSGSSPAGPERGDRLRAKLRELERKKHHMETLVSEFQKLQMATNAAASLNTYSSSGEDSGDDEPSGKCVKTSGNLKNEDPFKLMEIKAIKAALQKTKDLMRSVEKFEVEQADDAAPAPGHAPAHDNKSEGGWSSGGSVCRVRNELPAPRSKCTNERRDPQRQQPPQPPPPADHEANIAALQQLAQELRAETENIMSERARIKEAITDKELNRKQKKVNEEAGPAERRQRQLRALLQQKQMQLQQLLHSQVRAYAPPLEAESPAGFRQEEPPPDAAFVAHHSYHSEDEQEPDCRSEQLFVDTQTCDADRFPVERTPRGPEAAPASFGCGSYASDSDRSAEAEQRGRPRRRRFSPPAAFAPRWPSPPAEAFSQSGQSQSGALPFPALPYNVVLPFGVLGGCACACACSAWGAWAWQQLAQQQRQLAALREHVAGLEERWRGEGARHQPSLNNQVPPGNRANNYWDNFRSYSRQNLLSEGGKGAARDKGKASARLPAKNRNLPVPAKRTCTPPPADFLGLLRRELRPATSDELRARVLRSVRAALQPGGEGDAAGEGQEPRRPD